MNFTVRKILFSALVVTLAVTYFMRTRLNTVTVLRPETFAEPIQTPLAKPAVIKFSRNDYHYEATALFTYQISGLIVHKLNYSWFTIDRSEKAFPVDLCLIWGDNLKNKIHQNPSIRFSQDCRWCYVQWHGDVPFQMNQLSNNHLLVSQSDLEKKLKSLLAGDQVTIKGKLVNVKATLAGKRERYDSDSMTWNTSTTRTDTGAGACEVIYAEEITVLQPANVLARQLYRASLYGLGALLLWSVAGLFV